MNEKAFMLGLSPGIANSESIDTSTLYLNVGKNTGNLVFHYAVSKHILELERNTIHISWGKITKGFNQLEGIGVIPAANHLRSGVDHANLAKGLKCLTCKTVMIGLGAQSNLAREIPVIKKGVIDWVRQIAQHAPSSSPNISLRGEFSMKVLTHYDLGKHGVVLGCPSLFISQNPELGQQIASKTQSFTRIAVVSGNKGWKHQKQLEASLGALVSQTNGSYVGQGDLSMIKLTRGEAALMSEKELGACRDYVCPDMDIKKFVNWSQTYGNVFFDIPSWMEHYKDFDFVIGTRFHGIALAIQAGIPALCLAHDSRTQELCQTMMIPYVLAKDFSSGITLERLPDLFQFDAKAFDINRRELARKYTDFLKSNHLQPVKWLQDIAEFDKNANQAPTN